MKRFAEDSTIVRNTSVVLPEETFIVVEFPETKRKALVTPKRVTHFETTKKCTRSLGPRFFALDREFHFCSEQNNAIHRILSVAQNRLEDQRRGRRLRGN